VAAFEAAEAAVAPIYDPADIVADPQFNALGTVHRIHDDDLGEMAMQGPLFRLSRDEASIAFTGRAHGADTDAVLRELGYTDAQLSALHEDGSIR
jgi:crotonobetainyl-CoA:carnitine CoA-transferase CaiB-like acyl-CoA transferase